MSSDERREGRRALHKDNEGGTRREIAEENKDREFDAHLRHLRADRARGFVGVILGCYSGLRRCYGRRTTICLMVILLWTGLCVLLAIGSSWSLASVHPAWFAVLWGPVVLVFLVTGVATMREEEGMEEAEEEKEPIMDAKIE